MMARSQGPMSATASGPAQVAPQIAGQMATNPLAVTARAGIPNQLAVPGSQARPRPPMQAPPNAMAGVAGHMGGALVPPMPMNGIPQAQMQAMQNQHRMQMANPQPDMHLVLQARRIQDQQRAAVQQQLQQQQQQQQQQAAQQHGQQQQAYPQQPSQAAQPMPQGVGGIQGSPTGMRAGMNGINQQNYMANAQAQAIMASFNASGAAGGMATPPAGLNMPSVVAGSPRATVAQPTHAPPAVISQLEAQIKLKHPNMPTEQARELAVRNYQQVMAVQRQNALASASGGSPQQAIVNGITSSSPHA